MASQRPFFLRLGVKDQEVARKALANLGTEGERTLRKLEQGAQRANRQTGQLTRGAGQLQGAMSGLSRTLGPVGSGLELIATRGGLATAAIVAIGAAATKTVAAGTAYERQMGRIESLLRSTGGASGQTARSIDELSVSIGKATLASTSGARDAAAALLTFRDVGGEAFGRTLRLSQDLAEVFGTQMRSAVLQLGKALQDPERNLSQLNRSGISFSQTQIDLIKNFVETGDKARAMSEILGTIEAQVGGAGQGAAAGLAGAWDTLTENTGRYFELISQEGGRLSFLSRALRSVAGGVDSVNQSLSTEGQLAGAEREVNRLIGQRRGRSAAQQIANALGGTNESLRKAIETRDALREQLAAERALIAAEAERAEAARQENLRRSNAEAQETAARKERAKADKAAATAAKKAADDLAKRTAAGDAYIRQLDDENNLLRVRISHGADEVEILEAEAKLRDKLGKSLLPDEIGLVRELITEKQALNRAIEETEEAEKRAADAAKKAAEDMVEATRNATNEIVGFGRDLFEDVLSGATSSFAKFFDSILAFGRRTFAQLAAEAVIRPIVQPIVAGVVGGGARSLLGLGGGGAGAGSIGGGGINFEPDLFGGVRRVFGGLFGAGSGGVAVGPSGVGQGIDSLFGVGGEASGIGFGSGLGSAGFAALAILGRKALGAIGLDKVGIGLLGPSIEEVLADPKLAIAPAIGLPFLNIFGLFGRKKSPKAIQSGSVVDGRAVVGNLSTRRRSGEDVRGVVSGAVEVANALVIDQLGGLLAGGGSFNAGVRKNSLAVQIAGRTEVFGRPDEANLNAAADFLAARLIATRATGIDSDIESAFRTTQPEDLETVGRIIDLVQGLKAITAEPGEELSAFEAALKQLADEFEVTRVEAKSLGISLSLVSEAEEKRTEQLKQQFETQITAAGQGLFNGARSGFAALTDPLSGALLGLRAGPASALSPGERLGLAQGRFDDILARAQAGEVDAIAQLSGAGTDLVGLSREFNATGPAFAQTFQSVTGAIEGVLNTVTQQRDDFLADVAVTFKNSIETQTETLSQRLDVLRDELKTLSDELRRVRAA